MSEMEYQRREGAKEAKRKAEYERTKDWETFRKSEEWKRQKEEILRREREDRGSTPVRTKTPSVKKD